MSSTTPSREESSELSDGVVGSLGVERGYDSRKGIGEFSADARKFLGILLGGVIAGLSVFGYDTATTTQSEGSGTLTRFVGSLQDNYKELRFGISTKEMDALRNRIADFFAAHPEHRQHAAYSDFMKIGGIIAEARSIAKKEGSSTEATIRYAGGEEQAHTLKNGMKTSLSYALDDFLSETNNEDESTHLYRNDPTTLIGTADMVAAELGIDIEDVLSEQKRQEILLIGMKRCMEAWDRSREPFHGSPHFGRFAKNMTMLLPKGSDRLHAIQEILTVNRFEMDPISQSRVQEEIDTAQEVLASQFPSSMQRHTVMASGKN